MQVQIPWPCTQHHWYQKMFLLIVFFLDKADVIIVKIIDIINEL